MATDEAQDRDGRGSRTASRLRVVLNTVLALVFAGVGFVVVDAVFFSGPGFDKYDDSIRGTHQGSARVAFGQRIGPDGDGCWPENHRDSSGRVFCDLVSIGGLHWDTGDVRVAEAVDIFMGSGYLCLVDEDNAPWCWEWSSDVRPRPARVPEGAAFRRVVGAGGFVCGQTPDDVTVACWTVGVGRAEYRQATHRFRDGPEWVMHAARDDPPGFSALQRGTGRSELFHAFTGAELTGQVEVPRLLVTETTP